MRKFKKIIVIFAVTLILTAVSAYSLDINLGEVQKNADKFIESMSKSLPFNSALGLNWSDAYIGQITAVPPRFGAGITAGFTTMEFDSINSMLVMFDIPLPEGLSQGGFPQPGYVFDARIGGINYPFDFGFKFGMFNLKKDFWEKIKKEEVDFTMDYLLIGGDLRFAVFSRKTSPLNISIGIGFNYMKGNLSSQMPGDDPLELDFDSRSLTILKPVLTLLWETKTLDFKAQASYKSSVFTPYIGFGAAHAWSGAGYRLTADEEIKANGVAIDNNLFKDELKEFGLTGITAESIEQYDNVSNWSFRIFTGFSINVPFIKIDLTGMFGFPGNSYGVTLGTRFQL